LPSLSRKWPIKYWPPVCVEKKVRTYLRSIVSSSTPNETIKTAVSVLTKA
jgi:hypothetical protein